MRHGDTRNWHNRDGMPLTYDSSRGRYWCSLRNNFRRKLVEGESQQKRQECIDMPECCTTGHLWLCGKLHAVARSIERQPLRSRENERHSRTFVLIAECGTASPPYRHALRSACLAAPLPPVAAARRREPSAKKNICSYVCSASLLAAARPLHTV